MDCDCDEYLQFRNHNIAIEKAIDIDKAVEIYWQRSIEQTIILLDIPIHSCTFITTTIDIHMC